MRGNKEGARLPSVMLTDRTRGDRHRLKTTKSKHNEVSFYSKVVKKWHKLPRAVVESPSLEILRTKLDMALLDQAWTR